MTSGTKHKFQKYAASGYVEELITQEYDTAAGVWKKKFKELFGYSESRRLLTIQGQDCDMINKKWILSSIDTLTYPSNNTLKERITILQVYTLNGKQIASLKPQIVGNYIEYRMNKKAIAGKVLVTSLSTLVITF